jgi:hypothetical protein
MDAEWNKVVEADVAAWAIHNRRGDVIDQIPKGESEHLRKAAAEEAWGQSFEVMADSTQAVVDTPAPDLHALIYKIRTILTRGHLEFAKDSVDNPETLARWLGEPWDGAWPIVRVYQDLLRLVGERPEIAALQPAPKATRSPRKTTTELRGHHPQRPRWRSPTARRTGPQGGAAGAAALADAQERRPLSSFVPETSARASGAIFLPRDRSRRTVRSSTPRSAAALAA